MFIVQVLCLDYVLHLTRRSWFAQHKTGRGTRDPEDLGIGNRSLLGLGQLGGGTEMSSQDLLLTNFVWLWGKTFFYPLWRFSVKLLTHCYLKCGFDFGGLSVTSRLKPGQNRGHLLGQPHPGSSSVRRRCSVDLYCLLCSGHCPGHRAYKGGYDLPNKLFVNIN